MELNLSRVDYFHAGSVFPNCLKALPTALANEQQKIAIANRDGILQVVGWNKVEPLPAYKVTLPNPISAIQLGGAIGTARDKIFISSGTMVRGFTKKGKVFLEFDTNLSEPVRSMYVMGGYLLTSGINTYTQYEKCRDAGFYISDDEINFVIALPIEKVKGLVPVLACRDRSIRVLEDAKLNYLITTEGIVTVLALLFGDGAEQGSEVVFGTADGKLGLVTIGKSEGFIRWVHDTDITAGVTCMDFYDLTTDGNKELIVGFDDGFIQVYSIDHENYHDGATLLFTQTCNESVAGVQGGVFGNSFEEILVVTNSGWLFGLTTETSDKKIRVDDGNFSISDDTRQKLVRLKTEIEELQGKVSYEREKYQAKTQVSESGTMSTIPHFTVNEKLSLNKEDASYLLTLEVESPIDTILIQSDVPVDLLDVEKNSAVVSFSQCDPESGNFLLVTFRCQANTTRIEVRLRTIEGQQGTIRAYITPRIQPKCCQVRMFYVKPLSLHVRCHNFDPNRPYNSLSLKGAFSLQEIHSWLVNCIPEIPDRVPNSGEASLTFVSAFLDTLLHCSYAKGVAEFKSDNVSTISILKDFITKEATNKKIQLEMEWDFNEESIIHTLQLIRPKLDGFLALSKQVALIDALKEIQAHDNDVTKVLSSDFQYVLNNAEKLKDMHKRQPSYLERLAGMITDLYIDKHKCNGVNVKSRVPYLLEVLDRHDFDLLVDFFQAAPNSMIQMPPVKEPNIHSFVNF